MERAGKMPKSLSGLMLWFERQIREELPERLHKHEPWHDRVSGREACAGIQPVGGSDTGAPAFAGDFRLYIEDSPSRLDYRDPASASGIMYYQRPMAATLARIARDGRPLMARTLLAVAAARFDWRVVADGGNWPHEMFEEYLRSALIRAWLQYRDWTEAKN